MVGIKECVEEYAIRRGISKAQAEVEFKESLAVVLTAIVKDGGVSFRNQFSIQTKIKKGRTGKLNGKDWNTKDKKTLSIRVGKELASVLNN